MNIQKNWTDKHTFVVQYQSQRICWQKCGTCEKKWKDIETENVHLDLRSLSPLIICDNCLKEIENEHSKSN